LLLPDRLFPQHVFFANNLQKNKNKQTFSNFGFRYVDEKHSNLYSGNSKSYGLDMDRKKILIVDDEENELLLLDLVLSKAGYSVTTTDNGKEALFLAKSIQPDLVIADLSMPVMDGGQVAEELKLQPETKDIPVLFLTGLYTKEQEAEKGHMIAGNMILAKPCESKTLLTMINTLLSSRPGPIPAT
jgi:CheY-like chemotaxis protein